MKKATIIIGSFALIGLMASCGKTIVDPAEPNPTTYMVPATYNFSNVDYTDQKMLIAMADQIGAEINRANTIPNTPVSAQKLKDMFNNTGGYFNDSAYKLNASGLKLSDFCNPSARADINYYFDSIAVYSQSSATAANGVAGVAVSTASPSKKYLLSPNGIFLSQVFKKTIMGVFAYQINSLVLNGSDNNTVIPGKGTDMEHQWDAAFGFFGVPVDFPTTTTGLKYLGAYSNQVDPGLHSNSTFMNAFLKGRAAISNKDMPGKSDQAALIIKTLDRFNAACIVQEMKETDANITANDLPAAYNTLSETIGFVRNFRYNTSGTRVITDAQIDQLEKLFDANDPSNPNLYNMLNPSMTIDQMKAKTDAIRQFIAQVYGFSAADLSLL